MKSTAPRANASKVTSAPRSVSDDTITTGFGRSAMMRDRQVRPSISGMLTSRVMTSGSNAVQRRQRVDAVAHGHDLEAAFASRICFR